MIPLALKYPPKNFHRWDKTVDKESWWNRARQLERLNPVLNIAYPSAYDLSRRRSLTIAKPQPASQDRARIVFDCRMANDPAIINKEITNENNTDVDRWADARRLRINGKPCS